MWGLSSIEKKLCYFCVHETNAIPLFCMLLSCEAMNVTQHFESVQIICILHTIFILYISINMSCITCAPYHLPLTVRMCHCSFPQSPERTPMHGFYMDK